MSATEEMKYTIAQANAKLDKDDVFQNELVSTRRFGDYMLYPSGPLITLMCRQNNWYR